MTEVVWGVDDPAPLRYFSRGGTEISEDPAGGTLVERVEGPAPLVLSATGLKGTLVPTTQPLGKVGVY